MAVNNKENKKFKVLFVSAVANFKGGAETCLKQFMANPSVEPILIVPELGELSDYAILHSIDFEVVSFGNVNKIRRPLKVTQICSALIDAIKAGIAIKKLAKQLKADVIHSNGLKTHGILSLARFYGNIPVICHIHDIPYTAKEKLFWKFLALVNAKLILVSKHCWANNFLPKNASVVPNGIKVGKELLEKKELTNELSIGFIGRLHPHKGLHLAIDWLIKAFNDGYKFKLYIRGEAAASEASYLSDIKKKINENNMQDICAFEGRKESYHEVYEGLDLTLMPSIVAEPFGLVAIESFDQGTPCFAYPSGALPSIIKHNETGYLCSNEDEFIDSLKVLLSSADKYNEIRFNAHQSLKTEFSIDTVYQKLDKQYLELLK